MRGAGWLCVVACAVSPASASGWALKGAGTLSFEAPVASQQAGGGVFGDGALALADLLEDSSLAVEQTPVDAAELLELRQDGGRPVNVYAGVDFVSQYVSRGLVFADEFSVQPWLELDFEVYTNESDGGAIEGVSWFVGNWNSISDNDPSPGIVRTGSAASVESWYEADVYTGVRVSWRGGVQTSLRFNWYTSPSDSFNQLQEIDFRVSYDDAPLWREAGVENFTLTPRVRIAKETRDSGGPEQWYFSPSITPSFTLEGFELEPTVKIPLVLGFGADGQYIERDTGDETHFGFFQTGIGIDVPLEVLAEGSGNLTLSASFDVIFLGEEDLSADRDEVETVFRFGLSYAF